MGCATTTVKVSSIIFNIILAIFAVVIIVSISLYPGSMREQIAIAAYIACSLIIFFALLGCFAAIRESVCLTATCAVFLLVLAALQIALTCIAMSNTGIRSAIDTVNTAWESNDMDSIQQKHKCCGKVSPQDYISLNKPMPLSCYEDEDATKETNLFQDGCTNTLQTDYDNESYYFAIVSWALIAFEIFGFLLALFLVINFRNTQRRMQF